MPLINFPDYSGCTDVEFRQLTDQAKELVYKQIDCLLTDIPTIPTGQITVYFGQNICPATYGSLGTFTVSGFDSFKLNRPGLGLQCCDEYEECWPNPPPFVPAHTVREVSVAGNRLRVIRSLVTCATPNIPGLQGDCDFDVRNTPAVIYVITLDSLDAYGDLVRYLSGTGLSISNFPHLGDLENLDALIPTDPQDPIRIKYEELLADPEASCWAFRTINLQQRLTSAGYSYLTGDVSPFTLSIASPIPYNITVSGRVSGHGLVYESFRPIIDDDLVVRTSGNSLLCAKLDPECREISCLPIGTPVLLNRSNKDPCWLASVPNPELTKTVCITEVDGAPFDPNGSLPIQPGTPIKVEVKKATPHKEATEPEEYICDTLSEFDKQEAEVELLAEELLCVECFEIIFDREACEWQILDYERPPVETRYGRIAFDGDDDNGDDNGEFFENADTGATVPINQQIGVDENEDPVFAKRVVFDTGTGELACGLIPFEAIDQCILVGTEVIATRDPCLGGECWSLNIIDRGPVSVCLLDAQKPSLTGESIVGPTEVEVELRVPQNSTNPFDTRLRRGETVKVEVAEGDVICVDCFEIEFDLSSCEWRIFDLGVPSRTYSFSGIVGCDPGLTIDIYTESAVDIPDTTKEESSVVILGVASETVATDVQRITISGTGLQPLSAIPGCNIIVIVTFDQCEIQEIDYICSCPDFEPCELSENSVYSYEATEVPDDGDSVKYIKGLDKPICDYIDYLVDHTGGLDDSTAKACPMNTLVTPIAKVPRPGILNPPVDWLFKSGGLKAILKVRNPLTRLSSPTGPLVNYIANNVPCLRQGVPDDSYGDCPNIGSSDFVEGSGHLRLLPYLALGGSVTCDGSTEYKWIWKDDHEEYNRGILIGYGEGGVNGFSNTVNILAANGEEVRVCACGRIVGAVLVIEDPNIVINDNNTVCKPGLVNPAGPLLPGLEGELRFRHDTGIIGRWEFRPDWTSSPVNNMYRAQQRFSGMDLLVGSTYEFVVCGIDTPGQVDDDQEADCDRLDPVATGFPIDATVRLWDEGTLEVIPEGTWGTLIRESATDWVWLPDIEECDVVKVAWNADCDSEGVVTNENCDQRLLIDPAEETIVGQAVIYNSGGKRIAPDAGSYPVYIKEGVLITRVGDEARYPFVRTYDQGNDSALHGVTVIGDDIESGVLVAGFIEGSPSEAEGDECVVGACARTDMSKITTSLNGAPEDNILAFEVNENWTIEEGTWTEGRVLEGKTTIPNAVNLTLDTPWSDDVPIFKNKNDVTYGYKKED